MIKFELTIEESNLVVKSLAKLPYEESAQLIAKLVKVGNEQVKKPE